MRRLLCAAAVTLLCVSAMPVLAGEFAPGSVQDCWIRAFRAADADAVTKCYAPDAVLWIPGAPMAKGSQEIHDGYESYFNDYTIKSVELIPMGGQTVGDDAVTWGAYKIVIVPTEGGDEATETGRYTDVAKKLDGHWVYVVDHASDDPPPAG